MLHPRASIGLLALAASLAASAQVPLPPERPAEVGGPAPAAPAPPAPSAPNAAPPAVEAVPPVTAAPPLPPERPSDVGAASPSPALAIEIPAPPDDTACRGRLDRLGAKWEALPPIADGPCGAPRPLRLTAIGDGIALEPAIVTVCPVAESLARWTTEVRVAAERDLGRPLKTLRIGGSYECRGQNHEAGAKLSDHAHAGAVDVMGFTFDGRPAFAIAPQAEGTPEARFQATIHAAACTMFSTVLGPGADASHVNHFHLDLRERPKGFRICQ